MIAEPEEQSVVPSLDAINAFSRKTREYLCRYLGGNVGHRLWMSGQGIMDLTQRQLFYAKLVEKVEMQRQGIIGPDPLEQIAIYKWEPVGVQQFVEDPYYLNKKNALYPKVMEALIEINSGKYIELIATGGIGSGKSTLALYVNAYQLYLLSCMHSPHQLFNLDKSSEILLIFQSITAAHARGVDYTRFRDMIHDSPYFREKFPYDKNITSRLVFPNRIEVVPVSGAETAAIGQNVIGGLIDELNYMAIIAKSKQSVDAGAYDQATALYNSIARRRKSRFLEKGKLPGILCLVSSRKYPGQFTDKKEEEREREIAETGSSTIYLYDKRVWDIKPEGTLTGEWFRVFIGDETRKPRILEKDEFLPEADRQFEIRVPVEYLEDFKTDIINALREIAGLSTISRHPYFYETDKVAACFKPRPSIFSQDKVDFVDTKLRIHPENFYKPHIPRWAHVDLAVSGDSAGLTIGCVDKFMSMKDLGRGSEGGYMPHFHVDGVLEIAPPRNSEILFYKIRDVIVKLRELGLGIRWVTFDSFQSTDSQQLLRQQGFVTGTQSMDVLPCKPYDFLKSAVYDGRITMPQHKRLLREINMLERDTKTGKIDHPPTGSKDCSDALAGVVYGLTMRREIWSMYSIPLAQIPEGIRSSPDKMETKNAAHVENQAAQGGGSSNHERRLAAALGR